MIIGLILFERINFSYGDDVVGNATLAWFQDLYVKKPKLDKADSDKSIAITGHRGSAVAGQIMKNGELTDVKIGNTRRGISAALAARIEFIEIDLRSFTGNENDFVLYHDTDLDKLNVPNRFQASGVERIEDLTLSRIRELSYRTKSPRLDRVVLLSEFLDLVSGSNQKIILDLKFASLLDGSKLTAAFEKIAFQLSQHQIGSDRVTIFGDFNILNQWITFLRNRKPVDGFGGRAFQLGYTVLAKHFDNRLDVLLFPSRIFEKLSQLETSHGGTPILVLPVTFASKAMLTRAIERRVEVWVYGTEDANDQNKLKQCGVDGFIVDLPMDFVKSLPSF